MSLVTGLFFLVLLLNQRWSPPLRLQASHCSTFRIMCDVPSIAVFCNESIECFPGTASKFFLKLLVTIPVAPIIIGIIVHFRFHIRCISIHKLLYFNFFSASFCTTFLSAGIATSISVHVFSFLFLIIISGLFAVTSLSVCTSWFHNTVTSPSSYTGLGTCVYHLSVVSMPKALYMFFWVFPRRQIVVGRRFGTLCQFHLQRLNVDCGLWEEARYFIPLPGFYWSWPDQWGRWGIR